MGSGTLNTSTDPQVGFRPAGTLDATTALQPYNGHFSVRHAAHLLRRAGFGGSPAEITALVAAGSASRAVDGMLHSAAAEAAFAEYPAELAEQPLQQGGKRKTAVQNWWLDRMLRTNHPLREKMVLFWHNHFATSINKSEPAFMAQQIALFRSAGLGNFRNLLGAVTQDPAMLIWLDNRYNTKQHPNENYAREVMELFALGLGNYTEDDVKEAARSFTGWQLKAGAASFNKNLFDDGIKTVLGKTGAFGTDDVINIIVQQPIHQRFIARKLLEFFVYSDPEPELIEGVARTYALAGYDIAKTVGTIFRSNVFFSTRAYRAMPKSPIEFAIGTLRYIGATQIPTNLIGTLARMGQEPLNPPSVKGWDGGPTWINTTTLLARFNFVNTLMATTAPPRPVVAAAAMAATAAAPASAKPPATNAAPAPVTTNAPNVQPDVLVEQSGGLVPDKIVATLVTAALQDDVTSDVRKTLVDYLNSAAGTAGAMNANAIPFGPENYQEKIRGVVALTLNLPVNQLN